MAALLAVDADGKANGAGAPTLNARFTRCAADDLLRTRPNLAAPGWGCDCSCWRAMSLLAWADMVTTTLAYCGGTRHKRNANHPLTLRGSLHQIAMRRMCRAVLAGQTMPH